MTGVRKVTHKIILLLQFHLIQSQWFYPDYSYPYTLYGYSESGQSNSVQQPYWHDSSSQTEVGNTQTISIPGNTYPPYLYQPTTIIINGNEDNSKGKGKDGFRIEEFLPLLLTFLTTRNSDRDNRQPPPPPPPPPPPSPQYRDGGGGCNCGGCQCGCCRCGCCGNDNRNNKGSGGCTVNITIVLPKTD